MLLSELAPLVNAQQGVIYQMETTGVDGNLVLLSAFADDAQDGHLHEMLASARAWSANARSEKRRMLITDLPPNTVPIRSGLFRGSPAERHRVAGSVRRSGEGGDRAGHPRAPSLLRTLRSWNN